MEKTVITGHVFIATSLDGFIAREDGDISWLIERDDPSEDHGYDDFIQDIDVIVMGRATYESVCHITPWFYNRPVVVLSSSLSDNDIPESLQGKVRVFNHSPQQTMQILAEQGYRKVYIDGGRVIQSFLALGLITNLVITRVPVLLGSGRPLFGQLPKDITLKHHGTRSFPSGLIQSSYTVLGGDQIATTTNSVM